MYPQFYDIEVISRRPCVLNHASHTQLTEFHFSTEIFLNCILKFRRLNEFNLLTEFFDRIFLTDFFNFIGWIMKLAEMCDTDNLNPDLLIRSLILDKKKETVNEK